MKKSILLTGIVAAMVAGCVSYNGNTEKGGPSAYTPAAAKADFEVLKQEQYGGREAESYVVIQSQPELNKLYESLGQDAAPTIDFTKRNVVALFYGQKNSGGYRIGIKEVRAEGDGLMVIIEKEEPSGMATTVLTAPYCIASVPKAPKTDFR
jgi:hypothetical protein